MNIVKLLPGLWLGLCILMTGATSSANDLIKVGVYKSDTVNWELDVIRKHKLDTKNGFRLEVVPLGSKEATQVHLKDGAVDIIATDWLWVAQQRDKNYDFTFSPYSNLIGSLLVSDNGMQSLAEAERRLFGIAGRAVDFNWLLLRAYSKKAMGKDIADSVEARFAEPHLINKLALNGELDAVLNAWEYAAQLRATGMAPLIDMVEILAGLDVDSRAPLIGWVFSKEWADDNTGLVTGFLQASQDAKTLLLESDKEWQRLRPKMGDAAEKEEVFTALRDAFREGIARCFGQEEVIAAKQVFEILAGMAGNQFTDGLTDLGDDTFWHEFELGSCN